MKKMKKLEFPEMDASSIAFGDYPQDWFDNVLNKIEKEEPVEYKWKDMMEDLFFRGGAIPVNEKLDEEYRKKGIRMLKAVIYSWTPKHEHKEIVVAHILRSICS